jgi:hypothetical protein
MTNTPNTPLLYRCTVCGEDLVAAAFYWKSTGYRVSACRSCTKAKTALDRLRMTPAMRQLAQAQRTAARERARFSKAPLQGEDFADAFRRLKAAGMAERERRSIASRSGDAAPIEAH